jgi:hypothetical protein
MSTANAPLTFPDPFEVMITYDPSTKAISVEPKSIIVNKDKGEHVKWTADGDFDFSICFERDTPFQSRHFHRGSSLSGIPVAHATGRYKYCVEVDGQTLDPQIIVQP